MELIRDGRKAGRIDEDFMCRRLSKGRCQTNNAGRRDRSQRQQWTVSTAAHAHGTVALHTMTCHPTGVCKALLNVDVVN